MKTIFKLGYNNSRPIYLTNEKAEEYYAKGKLPFEHGGWGYCYVRIPYGFYSRKLTFIEWLQHYMIQIL